MEYLEKLKTITNNLEKYSKVNEDSKFNENQADTLANALIDIEESLNKIKEQIPLFYNKKLNEVEVEETLLDIGEELRHILYHIKDVKFYQYLL
ncbi:MAG: hypothetical protein QM564_00505 [Bergeyella sp.]